VAPGGFDQGRREVYEAEPVALISGDRRRLGGDQRARLETTACKVQTPAGFMGHPAPRGWPWPLGCFSLSFSFACGYVD
jgi:hypothetical protein